MNIFPGECSRHLLEIAAFLLGLFLAYINCWTTTDLVWGLWLSSLFLGYASILSIIAAGLYFAWRLMCHKKFIKSQTAIFLLIVFSVAGFLFVFFSFHFCGFHAAHAAILSGFFPPPGVERGIFDFSFANPFKLLYVAWTWLVPLYGLFLISTAVAELPKILSPIISIRKLIAEGEVADAAREAGQIVEEKTASKKTKDAFDPFMAPYMNVMKTHCLLFFFAFAHCIRLDSFIVFAVAYSVYFFPERLHSVFKR